MDERVDDLSQVLPEHVDDVKIIALILLKFHEHRERTYKLSFAKRGEHGVWMNLARKYDRIDGLVRALFSGHDVGETLVDTLADTAIYALKWLAVIDQIRSDDWDDWLENVFCRETGISRDKVYNTVYDQIFPHDKPWEGEEEEEEELLETREPTHHPDPENPGKFIEDR